VNKSPLGQIGAEISKRANFQRIRYAQCWEDADILLSGLNIQPGDTCLSIASAGDNSLALLTANPAQVIALDLSRAQLHCLELRVAAYSVLEHHELLELIGSRQSTRRLMLYIRCRTALSAEARGFWDARPELIRAGIGSAGKFERYFALFRRFVLPLLVSQTSVDWLFAQPSRDERAAVFSERFETWRWKLLFRAFFSKTALGWLGRDPSFFKYTSGSPSEHLLGRARHALVELEPALNPYLEWILHGEHRDALPLALRPEHFETIRANLHKLEWHQDSLEAHLEKLGDNAVDRYNLSDIFEYMSPDNAGLLLERLARSGRVGGRLAYWNLLADRHRPEHLAHLLKPLEAESARLSAQDKAFFYGAFVLEEIQSEEIQP
jgi:S-adenosylmethionine-diacylglycerol 3-amino-3-carboxypropyl transferase